MAPRGWFPGQYRAPGYFLTQFDVVFVVLYRCVWELRDFPLTWTVYDHGMTVRWRRPIATSNGPSFGCRGKRRTHEVAMWIFSVFVSAITSHRNAFQGFDWHVRNWNIFCPWSLEVDWLIDWLTDWLIDWLIDRLIDWSLDWLIDWLLYSTGACGDTGFALVLHKTRIIHGSINLIHKSSTKKKQKSRMNLIWGGFSVFPLGSRSRSAGSLAAAAAEHPLDDAIVQIPLEPEPEPEPEILPHHLPVAELAIGGGDEGASSGDEDDHEWRPLVEALPSLPCSVKFFDLFFESFFSPLPLHETAWLWNKSHYASCSSVDTEGLFSFCSVPLSTPHCMMACVVGSLLFLLTVLWNFFFFSVFCTHLFSRPLTLDSHQSAVDCVDEARKNEGKNLWPLLQWTMAASPLVGGGGGKNMSKYLISGRIHWKRISKIWNDPCPMMSRRGQILLEVFYSMRVLSVWLATVSTQWLCVVWNLVLLFFLIDTDWSI